MSNIITLNTNFILFDLDGTLVNSTAAVEKSWEHEVEVHNKQHPDAKLDLQTLLFECHGSRTVETFTKSFPEKLPVSQKDIDIWESEIVRKYGDLGKPIPGSVAFLESLNEKGAKDSWAIITSGTQELAYGWYNRLFSSIPRPKIFITAHDVSNGKPDPEGYYTAFKKLISLNNIVVGVSRPKAIVFEDAPTGVKSGVNGGFLVIGIASTFSKEVLLKAGATYVIEDFSKVSLIESDDADEDEYSRLTVSLEIL
ncbi:2-deoxyglucose-6-phosphate phosphatase [Spathaspora passalidarum NRRL Y-27907]|uniref:2-deoxyglucose-6-phosphate phosphatase n=1 Tax=Spathaspora passalidarum (strain NRRL Y-27907 / 11-Y1) TaxID=619300 RepID=G3AT61_SPAPN|nr:2-deoxyglucose-6-phosphate phosphatase [Spathaspora passalidarum NRRL Y-27907]EGW30825.1 2-deoxyglucose-6-phosphate phosphatase [Spathaspora passalidarum NRRL Y-27907]